MIVSWNGELVDRGVVELPVTDALFLRGEGVFETMRFEAGAICLWERHYRRLMNSASRIGWKIPGESELEQTIKAVVRENDLDPARVRATVGKEILITVTELDETSSKVKAGITSHPVNERSPLAGIKGTSYAENIWILRESVMDEVIRPNTVGELCEGCISNVFFIKDGKVHTPSLDTGCLPGVMRAEIIDRVEVIEGCWPIEVLHEAEAIWLTNATRRLRLVTEFEGKSMPEACVKFKELSEALSLCGS